MAISDEELDAVGGGVGLYKKYIVHTVVKGDNLTYIARRYGCTVQAIVRANSDKIKNENHIEVGWLLIIPIR